jgi:hypothetical protein
VRGPGTGKVRATLLAAGKGKPLKLNRRGVAALPGELGHRRLLVRVRLRGGITATAVAPLAL